MARRLSRRSLALYVVEGLQNGKRRVAITHLAAYLIDTHRTKELELIVRDVQRILAERGVVVGTITSAFDLSTETKKIIEKFVASKTGSKDISLESIVDPGVLGGVKISLPGQELDQTIAHQLQTLRTQYKKA